MWQQGFDGVDDIVKAFGENAGNSIDQVIRDALHATASLTVIYASTAASRGGLASGMRLTGLEVRKALRKLRTNNAREFPDGTYHSIIHPDVETDLMADPNVQNILQWVVPRGENHPLLKGSVPQIYGVSFFYGRYRLWYTILRRGFVPSQQVQLAECANDHQATGLWWSYRCVGSVRIYWLEG
jgi:hypothetical protein